MKMLSGIRWAGIGAAALAFAAIWFLKSPQVPEATAPRPSMQLTKKPHVLVPSRTNQSPRKSISWEAVESADYFKYIGGLRNIGCPEETITDIVIADINKLYLEKAKQLTSITNRAVAFQYWRLPKRQTELAAQDAQIRANLLSLESDRKALLRTLLGPGIQDKDLLDPLHSFLAPAAGLTQYMDDYVPSLSPEKISAIRSAAEEKRRATEAELSLVSSPNERLRVVVGREREFEGKLKTILTPSECFEYLIRSSFTASTLMRNVDAMQPTEAEFRSLFKLQKQFEDEFDPRIPASNPEDISRKNNAEAILQKAIQNVLGPERFVDYSRAIDPAFRPIQDFADRAVLTKEQAADLYNISKLAQSRVQQIGNTASADARSRILADATTEITQRIGAEAAANFFSGSEGRAWIRTVQAGLFKPIERYSFGGTYRLPQK